MHEIIPKLVPKSTLHSAQVIFREKEELFPSFKEGNALGTIVSELLGYRRRLGWRMLAISAMLQCRGKGGPAVQNYVRLGVGISCCRCKGLQGRVRGLFAVGSITAIRE